jgi:hypothetical protein
MFFIAGAIIRPRRGRVNQGSFRLAEQMEPKPIYVPAKSGPAYWTLGAMFTFGPGTGIEIEFKQEGQLLDERAAYGEGTPRAPEGAARHRRST